MMKIVYKIVAIAGCLLILNLVLFGAWFYFFARSYLDDGAYTYNYTIAQFDALQRTVEKKALPFYIGALILLNVCVFLPKLFKVFFDKDDASGDS